MSTALILSKFPSIILSQTIDKPIELGLMGALVANIPLDGSSKNGTVLNLESIIRWR